MNPEDAHSTEQPALRARNEKGDILPETMRAPVTDNKRRMRGERRYMAQVAETFEDADFAGLAARILKDAFGDEGTNPKVINAAREWLRKVALGDGHVSIEDLECPPAVIRKR